MRGTVADRLVTAGRTGWLEENGIAPTTSQLDALRAAEESGATAIWVAIDGEPAGIISLRDTLKPESVTAVARLRELGLRPILLTGDNAAVAAQVAAAVGIDPRDVFAGVLPEGKVEAVRRLQADGATVAMAGDGVNDAAALAQADLGIAMGSGTDVAIQAADLTVMGSDLGQVAQAIELSRTDDVHDQDEPLLGVLLQRGRNSRGRFGVAQSDDCGSRHGCQFGAGGSQLAAAPQLRQVARSRPPAQGTGSTSFA